jgi:hypothetical protein
MVALARARRVPGERWATMVGVKIWMTSLSVDLPRRRRRKVNGEVIPCILADWPP